MPIKNSPTLDFWDKIKYIFSNPRFFFDNIRTEPGIKNSLIMYSIVGLFMTSISFLYSFLSDNFGAGILGTMSDIFGLPFIALGIAFFIIGIIVTFVYAGMIHIVVFAFKGRGKYSDTYNVYAYSSVPSLILSVIPVVGTLTYIYSFVLTIIGISRIHNISTGKSILACIWPILLLLGIVIIGAIYVISNFSPFFDMM